MRLGMHSSSHGVLSSPETREDSVLARLAQRPRAPPCGSFATRAGALPAAPRGAVGRDAAPGETPAYLRKVVPLPTPVHRHQKRHLALRPPPVPATGEPGHAEESYSAARGPPRPPLRPCPRIPRPPRSRPRGLHGAAAGEVHSRFDSRSAHPRDEQLELVLSRDVWDDREGWPTRPAVEGSPSSWPRSSGRAPPARTAGRPLPRQRIHRRSQAPTSQPCFVGPLHMEPVSSRRRQCTGSHPAAAGRKSAIEIRDATATTAMMTHAVRIPLRCSSAVNRSNAAANAFQRSRWRRPQ